MTEENTQVVETEVEVMKALATVKGFVVYKFDNEDQTKQVLETLSEELLSENSFKPCGKYDAFKSGFTPFKGEGDNYILPVKGSTMFQVSTQEKKPHAATVKKLCQAKEKAYMAENDLEKLDKETKDIIKQTVIDSLVPDTTPEEAKTTLLWITGNYLIVGNPKYTKAEEFVCTLRDVLGSVPVTPLDVVEDPTTTLTDMLKTRYNESLVLLKLVHLVHPDSKGVIKFEKESLLSTTEGIGKKVYSVDVDKHIKDGYVVDKIQLSKDYECDFTISTELEFSAVRVDKDVLAGTQDLGSVIVTVGEVNKAVAEVVKVFGGLK